MPLTIKQCLTATTLPGAKFAIDDKEVTNVTFVGVVVSADIQAASASYVVEDGSGQVTVRVYEDTTGKPQFREQTYIRVYGNMRMFKDTMNVVAFRIKPVVDYNEVTFHMLQVSLVNSCRRLNAHASCSTDCHCPHGSLSLLSPFFSFCRLFAHCLFFC